MLRTHLEARSYHACEPAARALHLPSRLRGAADLRMLAALAVAHTFGLLAPELAEATARRVDAALAGEADAALTQADADSVLAWCTAAAEWCERHGLDLPFGRLQGWAARADGRVGASTASRVHWRVAAAWHHEAFGRRREVVDLLEDAWALAAAAGDPALQQVVRLKLARLAIYRDDPSAAVARAAEVIGRADVDTAPLWLADAADIEARAALVSGDMHRALHQARRACALAALAGAPAAYTLTYRTNEAYAQMALGAWAEALTVLAQMAAVPLPARLHDRVTTLADLAVLLRAERTGPWTAADDLALRALVDRLRALDWPGVLAVLPSHIARLWARALDAGIEPDWVRASIVGRGLAPPEPSWPEAWPWPLRVQVLGPLQVSDRDGRTLLGGSKAAARPLALLRRLAAESGHDGMAADVLAEALWPGEGREGRHKALEVTLARLRRLLGAPDALLMHDRRLRLNPQCVWLDQAALVRLLDRLTLKPPLADVARDRAWAQVLALWRGPVLGDDGDAPWLQPLRLRLRQRMAAALLGDAAWPGHASRCLRAVAADPGLEPCLIAAQGSVQPTSIQRQ
ncbi:MAG: hypothetical protein H6932_09260 [Burkholderiaceae bacterium]|nr:hypothetical protein [Rhodoferax sp.]MCP5271410.1 hypothetical protein [Burkholderiaceae bacterium]